MFKHVIFFGLLKSAGLTFFFLSLHIALFSQTLFFRGIVKDEQTMKPIPDVNIKVYGTTLGTATDKNGIFSMKFTKIPATLMFTCVGYENEFYKVTEVSKNQTEFLLHSKSYNLREVNISSNNYSFLFRDNEYSVLDYELMDGNVLLLIFRTQPKQSQLILLSPAGDTLAVTPLPEAPPSRLFKDFLSNIHYFTKSGFAYQCHYNKDSKSMDFLYRTTIDSIQKFIQPFLFNIARRLYFQESIANKFGTAIGYYEKGNGKKYIRQVINTKKITEHNDDEKFYTNWNAFIGARNAMDSVETESDLAFDFSISQTEGGRYGKNERRAHSFEYFTMIFPVLKTKDNTIAVFNFGSDIIELMNKDGKILKTVPVSFHKETVSKSDTNSAVRLSDSGWRWGNMILVDEHNGNIYTTFLKARLTRINLIDLVTGRINKGTVLPLPFPEKIKIYDGEAYFLNKGVNENCKLAKCKL